MKRRGITLIELLVVIALVGIVLGLAAPAFNDMIARQRVRSHNDGLVTDIAFARSEAVSRRQAVRIAFGSSDAADCYTIYATNGALCDCGTCAAGAVELKTVRIPRSEDVRLTSELTAGGRREIEFDAVQASLQPAPVNRNYEVNFAHSRGAQLRSRIRTLGQVHVCSPNGSVSGVPTSCP